MALFVKTSELQTETFFTEKCENQRISFFIKNQSRILSSELPYNDIIFFSCLSGISHENTLE
jgi:hypothetical protein